MHYEGYLDDKADKLYDQTIMHHNNIIIRVRLRGLNILPGNRGLKIKWTRTLGQAQASIRTSFRLVLKRTSLGTDQSQNRPVLDQSQTRLGTDNRVSEKS